jgi:hypothetical protein
VLVAGLAVDGGGVPVQVTASPNGHSGLFAGDTSMLAGSGCCGEIKERISCGASTTPSPIQVGKGDYSSVTVVTS